MDSNDSYQNRRCRIQRLKDSKFLHGWVECFDKSECRIRLINDLVPWDDGERYNIEMIGKERIAQFIGKVASATGLSAALRVDSPIQYKGLKEQPRVCVSNVLGKVACGEDRVDVKVIDISESGLGVVSPIPLPSKSEVRFEILMSGVTIEAKGEVRYCRKNVPTAGQNRLGIVITDISRVDRGHLTEFVFNLNPAA